MSCALTSGFALDCKNGVGGVKAIHLIDWAATGFSVGGGEVTATTVASANTFTYDLAPNTANMITTATTDETAGTTYYTTEANFRLLKLSTAKRNELKLLTQGRVFVIVQDRMNNYWLCGKDSGCVVTARTSETGTAIGDMNGYNVTLQAMDSEEPYKLQASVVTTLGIS